MFTYRYLVMTYQLVNLYKVRPTELFLCKESLEYFAHTEISPEPIEILIDEDGEQFLSDGHNRAVAELKKGRPLQPANVHTVQETNCYGLAAYILPEAQKCLRCGIRTLRDLEGRVLATRAEVKQKSEDIN